MAYHGSRGGSRGRGGPRGGGRGAISSSRGRGRGRGGFRGGRGKPIFDSARLAQQKEQDENEIVDSAASSEVEEEEDDSQINSGSEEDEEPLPAGRSYATLMQRLIADSAPQPKRRKLDHASEMAAPQNEGHEDIEGDQVREDVDQVEEPEEGPETAIDGLLEDGEENDSEDASDPFEAHFADPDENLLSRRLKSLQNNQWATQKSLLPKVGRVIFSVPQENDVRLDSAPATISGPGDLKLKQKLASIISKKRPSFDSLEKYIAPYIFNYRDVLYCERDLTNSENLQRLVCLHAVNHVFMTRDRIIKNNARLARGEHSDELELRDQGFTRPKVLMILPTRESCVRMVNMITSICEPDQQENRKRFDDSFVEKEEKFSADKPEDFRDLFGGNDDDMFRLGLKFTRKTIKYFSQFYNSDIIFASPLGLRLALEGKEGKQGDSDVLSSIELVIVDQADALAMQNWGHVEYIFEHLNLQPKEAHGCDFSRVRSWYLDNNAKHFRQTIALTAFTTTEINDLFYQQSRNWAGRAKISASHPGAIQELGLKVKQTFSRLESPSFADDPDARFEYFTTTIVRSLTRRSKDNAGTIIFIPSYIDFVRVRRYLAESPAASSISFGSIDEYASVSDVARARSHFFNGRHSVLLYTERAHHFRRYQLRGVRRVIMYGLPDNPKFYKEIVGGYLSRSVQEGKLEPGNGSVKVIFSKWDGPKLEKIAGTERAPKMIMEQGDTFDFL